jgi:serine/threonine protein kinase/Tol biopolymer transport system component
MALLLPGARLGPYEILDPLGAGGMGEVYRARDTRLDRIVAIKVLGAGLSADSASRARFEQEARSIAALSHPHICTLHDVGEHAGHAFLVMELLEGQTLAARLARAKGGLPVAEALAIATAVAEALAFAHRHHIVHRDIKPANIMVTPAGVKLLDFGLARLRDRDELTGESRTQSALTEPHAVMGTLGYMSPEQLDGRADERSDVFGFGAVLFEMLTGRKAFAGATTAAVIAGIVQTELPPVSALRPEVSPGLDWLVRRCVAKAPEDRWQSTGDLVAELKWIADGGDRSAAPVERRPPTVWRVAAVVGAAGLLAGLAFGLRSRQSEPIAMPEVVQFRVPSPTGMFSPPPSVAEIALSPDGRRLAFVATAANGVRQLWVRNLDQALPQLVDKTGVIGQTWSPDGRQLAFYRAGKLWRLDLANGATTAICDVDGGFVLTPSWGANGELLFSTANPRGPIFAVPASGGKPRAVTTLAPGDALHSHPSWLPDGNHFLFNRVSAAGDGVLVGSLTDSAVVELPGISGRVFYSQGHLIYNQNETLFAQPFDASSLTTRGEPVVLAKSAGLNGDFSSLAVSDNGVLAYGGVNSSSRSRLSVISRDGRLVRNLGADDVFEGARVSPDGRLVATTILRATRQGALTVVDATSGLPVKLTTGGSASDRFPLWAADSASIVFSFAGLATGVSRIPLTGTAPVSVIPSRNQAEIIATDWSRDGRFIVYGATAGSRRELRLLTVADGTDTSLVTGPFEAADGRVSPDGRYLAFVSDESGSAEIYVQGFPQAGRRQRLSTDGGVEPRWRADGRELFYRSSAGDLMAVAIDDRSGLPAPTAATPLAAGIRWATRGGSRQPWTYDVMPDGRHFVVNAFPPALAFPDVTVTLNWPRLLTKQ